MRTFFTNDAGTFILYFLSACTGLPCPSAFCDKWSLHSPSNRCRVFFVLFDGNKSPNGWLNRWPRTLGSACLHPASGAGTSHPHECNPDRACAVRAIWSDLTCRSSNLSSAERPIVGSMNSRATAAATVGCADRSQALTAVRWASLAAGAQAPCTVVLLRHWRTRSMPMSLPGQHPVGATGSLHCQAG